MTSGILEDVAREPSLLRWLHSHDPDRDLTAELLDSSATYTTRVPQTEVADIANNLMTENSSLFVPMYSRGDYVLGQLYGPMSPNAMAFDILAKAGFGSPPHPICRRFVVDLGSRSCLQFLEYEWLSDGKLCLSIHKVTATGQYDGESILLDSPEPLSPSRVLTQADLLRGKDRPASPNRVIMRMLLTESPSCRRCGAVEGQCSCKELGLVVQEEAIVSPVDTWESWMKLFGRSRLSLTNLTMRFEMYTPLGKTEGGRQMKLQQHCEAGVGANSPTGNKLLLMFMESAGMLVSPPNLDQEFVAAEEKRDRYEIANDQNEDYFLPPVVVWPGEQEEETVAAPGRDDSAEASETLLDGGSFFTSYFSENPSEHRGNASNEITSASAGAIYDSAMNKAGFQPPQVGQLQESAAQQHNPAAARERERGERDGVKQRVSRTTRRRTRNRDRLFKCECGKLFSHKGHYNEHRLCVHEKVRQHGCLFESCSSRFFKRSDRDRHMRAKHDSAEISCQSCGLPMPNGTLLADHVQNQHPEVTLFTCATCSQTYQNSNDLNLHLPQCPGTIDVH